MGDDFFQELDAMAGESQAKQESKEARLETHKAKVAQFVVEVTPKLEEYKQQLENRGVHVVLTTSTRYFEFKMYFVDGGYWGFALVNEGDYFKVVTLFTEKGQSYKSWGGGANVESEWTWEALKKFAEKEIREFFFYAERHGGFKSKSR